MARVGRLVFGAVLTAGLLGGVLAGAAGTAQAQGVMGGSGTYSATGQAIPVGPVTVAQFPAAGLNPPYNPDTTGVPQTVDITIFRGRADFSPPLAGQFPLAFMTQQPPSPMGRQ